MYSKLVPIDQSVTSSNGNDVDNNVHNDDVDVDVDNVDKKKKTKKGKKNEILEQDIPMVKEIEIATKNVRGSSSKILASMRNCPLEEVLIYRQLSTLRDDLKNLEIVKPNDDFYFAPLLDENEEIEIVRQRLAGEREHRENGGLHLNDMSTQQFRYVGESKKAEEFFDTFGDGAFAKPLLLVRRQYSKLDISIKSNGERGASEIADEGVSISNSGGADAAPLYS